MTHTLNCRLISNLLSGRASLFMSTIVDPALENWADSPKFAFQCVI